MKRNLLVQFAILIVLGIIAYVVLRQPGEVSSSGSLAKTLVEYDSAAVDRIDISSPRSSVRLENQGGGWMVTSPVNYRADETTVTSAVGTGRKIELTSLVSSNPNKRKLFQVDSSGTLVTIYENGKKEAAFYIGKMGSTYTETYVRAEGSDDVYIAKGFLSATFNRQVKEWRDRSIFKTDQNAIRSVKFQYGDTTFVLTLQDTVWRIGQDSASLSVVRSFLGSLSNLQADEFVDTAVTIGKPPVALLQAEGTQLRFYAGRDSGKYLVQTSASPQWFELLNWRASQVLKRKKDFLPA
jgi:hypothetical protein